MTKGQLCEQNSTNPDEYVTIFAQDKHRLSKIALFFDPKYILATFRLSGGVSGLKKRVALVSARMVSAKIVSAKMISAKMISVNLVPAQLLLANLAQMVALGLEGGFRTNLENYRNTVRLQTNGGNRAWNFV